MASDNFMPCSRHLVRSEAFGGESAHLATTCGSDTSLSSGSDVRRYLQSYIDSRVLAAYTVIGLREFKLDNERQFISLAVGGRKRFLTLAEWMNPNTKKAEKGAVAGKKTFDEHMEKAQSTGSTSKFNICIQIDNIGRHQDQRNVQTVSALGQKGAKVIKYWWDEYVTRTKDDYNPSMLGTNGRRFEDVVLLGFVPNRAGVWVYSCILGIKSAASDSPAGVQPEENYANPYMSPFGPGSGFGSIPPGFNYPSSHDILTSQRGLWNGTINGFPLMQTQTMSSASFPGTSQDFPSAGDQGHAVGGSSHVVINSTAYNGRPATVYTSPDYYRGSVSTVYSSNASGSLDIGYGSPSGTQQTGFGSPVPLGEEHLLVEEEILDLTANTPHHFGHSGRNAHQHTGDSMGGASSRMFSL